MSDTFFKEKKPWSKYKDFILDYYLTPYIAKVKYLNRPILIIDCCAGPGKFEDGKEGSPLIITRHIIESRNNRIEIKGLFLEKKKKYFKSLENIMRTNRWGQTPKLTFHELIKKFRQAHYPVSRWREIAIVYDS